MSPPSSVGYLEAKARVIRGIDRITSFVTAAGDHKANQQNTGKRAKIEQMLRELNDIDRKVEDVIQYMEMSVSQETAPIDVTDSKDS